MMDITNYRVGTTRELQMETVRILENIADICERNALTYYLGFGTLLGAVRYQGYIPWDDDIDLHMPRNDYNKFLALCKESMPNGLMLDHYSIEHYQSLNAFIRVESSNVVIEKEIGGAPQYFPCWVSIFAMDGVPANVKKQQRHINHAQRKMNFLRLVRSSEHGLGNVKRSRKENLVIALNKIIPIGKLFSTKKAAASLTEVLTKYDLDTSDFVLGYTAYPRRCVYKKEWYGNGIKLMFEGREYNCPENYRAWLAFRYGDDYMTPPPENQQHYHQEGIYVLK